VLTPHEDQEISALAAQGWSISAIARHLGHDRKTIRVHLCGHRSGGQRRFARPDPFERFVPYVRGRLADHPDLSARSSYQELVAQGFDLSYPTSARGSAPCTCAR
jgi:transposase